MDAEKGSVVRSECYRLLGKNGEGERTEKGRRWSHDPGKCNPVHGSRGTVMPSLGSQ